MRCAEILTPKPRGECRILFVGDSVTYGTTYVDQSQIFTSLLAADLPARLRQPVEVLNASAGGWAIDNELGFLQSRGIFDSDLVVFVINTGDLVQPFNAATVLSLETGYPEDRPHLALSELWIRYLRPRLFSGAPADAGATPTLVAGEEPQARHNLESLEQAHRYVLGRGGRFAILFVPSRGGDWERPEFARDLAALRRSATLQRVPFLDLTGALSAAPPDALYFAGGIHLRAYGHSVVAGAIANRWGDLIAQ